MKRFLAIALLALTLAGCGFNPLATVKNPVTPATLYDIESVYGVALAGAVAYRNRPRCTVGHLESVTNICARRSIVVKLQQADQKAQLALGKAKVFVVNNPTLNATAIIIAAQNAVSDFYAIQNGATP